MEPFSLNILLTEEEYVNDVARECQRITVASPLALLAALIGMLGRIGDWFGLRTSLGFLSLGLVLAVYDLWFRKMFAKSSAQSAYQRRRELRQTVSVTFTDEGIRAENASISGLLPYELAMVTETPQLLVYQFGEEWTLRVPIRLLSEEQLTLLRQKAGEDRENE